MKKKSKAAASVKSPKSQKTRESEIVAIVSDIHFDQVHWPTWNAFRQWHADVRPDKTIILGDGIDFGMLSRFLQDSHSPVHAIPQIAMFVEQTNALAKESGQVIVMEGNHDERWDKAIFGTNGWALKGAKGLSLQDQCVYHGLDKSVVWMKENMDTHGVKCGPFVLRHGHRQSGRFGGAKHLAYNRLVKSMGVSEVFGHHHKAQLYCQSAHGKTAIGIANPHMSCDHSYASDPDWQRGFTILELFGPDNCYATPHLIIMQDGQFAWGGKLYDGNP